MSKTPRRGPSAWERVDGLLLLAALAVALLVALQVLSWLAGAISFLVKAALVVLIIAVIARLLTLRRR